MQDAHQLYILGNFFPKNIQKPEIQISGLDNPPPPFLPYPALSGKHWWSGLWRFAVMWPGISVHEPVLPLSGSEVVLWTWCFHLICFSPQEVRWCPVEVVPSEMSCSSHNDGEGRKTQILPLSVLNRIVSDLLFCENILIFWDACEWTCRINCMCRINCFVKEFQYCWNVWIVHIDHKFEFFFLPGTHSNLQCKCTNKTTKFVGTFSLRINIKLNTCCMEKKQL